MTGATRRRPLRGGRDRLPAHVLRDPDGDARNEGFAGMSRIVGSGRTSGDGGNRTRVRNRVTVTSTSVSGALISPSGRLAGGVPEGQLPEMSPVRRERTSPGDPAF